MDRGVQVLPRVGEETGRGAGRFSGVFLCVDERDNGKVSEVRCRGWRDVEGDIRDVERESEDVGYGQPYLLFSPQTAQI